MRLKVASAFWASVLCVGGKWHIKGGSRSLVVLNLLLSLSCTGNAAEIGLSRQTVAGANPPVAVAAVIISGQIMAGDAHKVAELLVDAKRGGDQHQILRLLINSPGGLVGEAIQIGQMARSNGMEVFIPPKASCISACVLILAGGALRTIDGQVGIDHPHFLRAAGPGDDVPKLLAQTKEIMRAYFKSMGVAEDLANVMFSVPEGDLRILRQDELLAYRLH